MTKDNNTFISIIPSKKKNYTREYYLSFLTSPYMKVLSIHTHALDSPIIFLLFNAFLCVFFSICCCYCSMIHTSIELQYQWKDMNKTFQIKRIPLQHLVSLILHDNEYANNVYNLRNWVFKVFHIKTRTKWDESSH